MSKEITQTTDPVRKQLETMAPKLALPAQVDRQRYASVAATAINSNPDLLGADRRSLFQAVSSLAATGLMPDGKEAALVVFNSKRGGDWVKSVQAMPMIGGLMKLMRQSGEVAWIDAQVVYARDKFQYRPGLDETPIFEPQWFSDRGEPIGVYAVARLKSGEIVPPEIMSLADIDKVRAASRSGSKGPWADWWEQMALKSVLRRLMKRLPSSTDIERVFSNDETMKPRADYYEFPAVQQIEHDEPEPEPQPTSALKQLEEKAVAEEKPKPKPKGRPPKASKPEPEPEPQEAEYEEVEQVDEQGWKDRIDGVTTLIDLQKLRKEFHAQHGENGSEAVAQAFADMEKALKRQ